MVVHFTYEDQKPDGDLKQGDLLAITDDLREVLKQFHPHYASNPDYQYLIVLTQSCDLAFRNGRCASRYLSLAAVRPLETLIEQEIERQSTSSIEINLKILPEKKRHWIEDFIEKLLNNNLTEYFYLEAESALNIDKAYVAYLALSIAIKSEHYKICKDARFGQLREIFRAKLGWLVGNMYSRVATPDWVPMKVNNKDFEDKVSNIVEYSGLWVNAIVFDKLASEQKKRRAETGDKSYILKREEIQRVIDEYAMKKTRKQENVTKFVVEQVASIITGAEKKQLRELENQLLNNSKLEELIA